MNIFIPLFLEVLDRKVYTRLTEVFRTLRYLGVAPPHVSPYFFFYVSPISVIILIKSYKLAGSRRIRADLRNAGGA